MTQCKNPARLQFCKAAFSEVTWRGGNQCGLDTFQHSFLYYNCIISYDEHDRNIIKLSHKDELGKREYVYKY